MNKYYGDEHRALHQKFDTERMADMMENKVIQSRIGGRETRFIETADMFFLSTIDHGGRPTVSYKGGAPGFVRVLDDTSLAFPCYDGNGMFYSMGNIAENAQVGLLFIDFETPRRLRLHGTATVSAEDQLLSDYPEAMLIARIAVDDVFINCSRYIHRYQRLETSEHVPAAGKETPLADWQRLPASQSLLPAKDQGRAEKAGGLITEAEYNDRFWGNLD